VIDMVKKVGSIADANRVLRMVRENRAVPVSQLRSALVLIGAARSTAMATNRAMKREIKFLDGLVTTLTNKM
jgi:hypothetical protein